MLHPFVAAAERGRISTDTRRCNPGKESVDSTSWSPSQAYAAGAMISTVADSHEMGQATRSTSAVVAAVSAAILERSKTLQFIHAVSLMAQGETNSSF